MALFAAAVRQTCLLPRHLPTCLQEAGEALFMTPEEAREARAEVHRELTRDESTAEEREVG